MHMDTYYIIVVMYPFLVIQYFFLKILEKNSRGVSDALNSKNVDYHLSLKIFYKYLFALPYFSYC